MRVATSSPGSGRSARSAAPVIAKILRGPWNEDLFRVLEGFPDLAHDDEVDACSGALEMLNPDMKGYGAFEAARQRADTWAPGSMEWLAEKNKSSSTAAPAPKRMHESSGPPCMARQLSSP